MGHSLSVGLFIDLFLQHADVRQVAVTLVVVEAVADDEGVGHLEAGVVRINVRLTARGLVHQRGDRDGGRLADLEIALEVVQRHARVEDVLDEDDVPALDGLGEVLVDADRAGGGRAPV